MANANWRTMDYAPKDGRKVLLIAKLDLPGEEPGPVVGRWYRAPVEEWRPTPEPLNTGRKLIPSLWMEIPEFPSGP
jgi:hypothetical protein